MVDGEQVLGSPRPGQLKQVEEEGGASDDSKLPNLNAIDPRQNVDGISTENCQHPHVDVVEDAWMPV